jgi:hypothetical protein
MGLPVGRAKADRTIEETFDWRRRAIESGNAVGQKSFSEELVGVKIGVDPDRVNGQHIEGKNAEVARKNRKVASGSCTRLTV